MAAPLTRESAFPYQEGVRGRSFPTVMRAAARRRVIRHPPPGQGSAQAVAALAFAARTAAMPALRHRR